MRVLKKICLLGLCSLSTAWLESPAIAQAGVQAESQAPPAASSFVAGGAAQPSNQAELPDSPGTVLAQLGEPAQTQSTPSGAPATQASPSPAADTQSAPQKPVGTAASEAPSVTGVAASQPAGVAIAPARQHRVRTIVLKMGAIIGAGVAVGTVVALTAATPSRPPGAH